MYVCHRVKYALLCGILMKLEFSGLILEHFSNIKFQESPSSGSRIVPCRRTDEQTDVTKLTAAFRNFVNALKNREVW